MSEPTYDLEVRRVLAWVKHEKAPRVLVQAPDGIKRYVKPLLESLEEAGVEVLVSASHTWGGCDVAISEARSLGVKHIIHLGHHGPVRFTIPRDLRVLFVPCKVSTTVKFEERLPEALAEVGACKVCLVATVQHAHSLDRIVKSLRPHGIEAVVDRSNSLPRGVVIGCDYSSALSVKEVDAYLVIAGGIFHALGLALLTEKPVISADPFTGEIRVMEEEKRKCIAKRLSALSNALDASEYGIVVSIKPGQCNKELAMQIARLLDKHGLKARILVVDEVSWDSLYNLGPPDAYVNTACPRLAIDDAHLFPAPALNPGELEYVLRGSLEGYNSAAALSLRL